MRCCWPHPTPGAAHRRGRTSSGPLGDRVIHEALARASADRTVDTSWDSDFGGKSARLARYFSRGPLNQIIAGPRRRVVHNDHEYLTDYFGDRAAGFIRDRSRSGQPYFLYLAFNAPHAPHMVTAKYYDRFPQIKDHQERVYAAMIAALDENVGTVLDAVRASGQADRTVIVFASDNGCAAYFPGLCSCWPLRGGKLSYYEGGIRVPFMMSWPAISRRAWSIALWSPCWMWYRPRWPLLAAHCRPTASMTGSI